MSGIDWQGVAAQTTSVGVGPFQPGPQAQRPPRGGGAVREATSVGAI